MLALVQVSMLMCTPYPRHIYMTEMPFAGLVNYFASCGTSEFKDFRRIPDLVSNSSFISLANAHVDMPV